MSEPAPALEAVDLTFRYPESDEPVLRGLSLRIEPGETVLLLGPSGSGKSTLALCLNGLIPHVVEGELSGSVRVFGTPVEEWPAAELLRRIGMVFQDPESQMVMPRADEEIAFGLENLGVAPEVMPERIAEALALVGLSNQARAHTMELSGGQKQRLALATILAVQPEVLVLDEPTANLDPSAARDFYRLLADLKRTQAKTMVLIEHRVDEALPLVDRVVALDAEGRLLVEGHPSKVFSARGEELTALGIWMPAPWRLARALEKAGCPLPGRPLTVEAAVRFVCPLLASTSPAGSEGAGLLTDASLGTGLRPAAPLSDAPPALAAEGVTFAYPEGEAVLRDLTWTLPQGAFGAVVGCNGSGKTTLARCLAGLLRPQRGYVSVRGREWSYRSKRAQVQEIGYVFQNPEHQLVSQRVEDELLYSLCGRWGEAEAEQRAEKLLHTFGLAAYADANPYQLSQGQKRRLSVATMVALDQPILILDEPTFGQDQRSAAALMGLLRELHARGTTILMITHDLELVLEYAQVVTILEKGGIAWSGDVQMLPLTGPLAARNGLVEPPLAELGRLCGRSELRTQRDVVRAACH